MQNTPYTYIATVCPTYQIDAQSSSWWVQSLQFRCDTIFYIWDIEFFFRKMARFLYNIVHLERLMHIYIVHWNAIYWLDCNKGQYSRQQLLLGICEFCTNIAYQKNLMFEQISFMTMLSLLWWKTAEYTYAKSLEITNELTWLYNIIFKHLIENLIFVS